MAFSYPTIIEPEISAPKRRRRSRNASGVPLQTRKSRGKSKTGCATCKRRHIRCDEAHPKCRNCVIHKSECEYQQVNQMLLLVQDNDSCTSLSNASSPCPSPEWERRSISPQPLPFWSRDVQESLLANDSPRALSPSPTLSNASTSSTASLASDARAQLDFYKTIVVPNMFPTPAKARAWNEAIIPYAYSDPAVLHAIWALTSFTLATLKKPLDLSEYQHHKLISLQHINQKLTDEQDATALSTIYAIVVTIGTELAANGDSEETMIHLTGLRNIINLRGGWESVPFAIKEIATYIDLCFALKRCSFPVFEEMLMPIASSQLLHYRMDANPDPQLLKLGSAFSDPQLADCMDPEMHQICHDMRETMLLQEACLEADYEPRLVELQYFDIMRLKTMHRLVSLPFYTQSESPIQKACRLAMIVLIVQSQFGLSKQTATSRVVLEQLWSDLAYQDTTGLWDLFPQVMSWIVTLGARASSSPTTRDWFIEELKFGLQRLELSCWQELEQSLQHCLYIRRQHREWLQPICDEL